jgi:serine/threonine protein kinase
MCDLGLSYWTLRNVEVRTSEEFLRCLEKSRLLTPEQLAHTRAEFATGSAGAAPAPQAVADALVERDWITAWQARLLLGGQRAFFVGKYKLLDRLGGGGMGTVFKAHHAMTDRIVALKMVNRALLANPPAVARFRTEVRLICSLNHPNIITAHDADSDGNVHFLVMEFFQGRDLRVWLKNNGPLPVDWSCDCIRQAALALEHARQRGLVHRDIKPENILADGHDTKTAPAVKLLDLGLARLTHEEPAEDADLAGEGQVMGTPDYISPEQATSAGAADIRSDIYSLGVTLFKIVTGVLPFEEGDVRQRLMARLLKDAPTLSTRRPGVPAEFDLVVARMLAREPGERYQTPAEVAEALRPFTIEGQRLEREAATPVPGDAQLGSFLNRMASEQQSAMSPAAVAPAPVPVAPTPSPSAQTPVAPRFPIPVAQAAAGGPSRLELPPGVLAGFTSTPGAAAPIGPAPTVPAAIVSTPIIPARIVPVPTAAAPIAAEPTTAGRAAIAALPRPTSNRRHWILGVAVGMLTAVPVIGLMAWFMRPSALVLDWPVEERRSAGLDLDGNRLTLAAENPVRIKVSPGRHKVVLRRRGYEPIEWHLTFARGQRIERQVEWTAVDYDRPLKFGRGR